MRLSSFRTRILVSAVFTALLSLVLVIATVTITFESAEPRELTLPDAIVSACRADPVAWSNLLAGHQIFQGFDERGIPADPSADPLVLSALPPLGVGERLIQFERPRIKLLQRTAESGPCAYLLVSAGPPPHSRDLLPWALAVGTSLAVLAAWGATYLLVVVPLLRRIDAIGASTRRVGLEGYASADDPVNDALGDIARVLDRSHERIIADKAELLSRHEALERYMAEIAHDLRTPISSLLLAIQELIAEGGAARRALQDAIYVSTLVENLHHAARLRHGLDPAEGEVDLREVALRLEVRFQALSAADGIEVAASVPDEPVLVRCNPAFAERAIGNLLHNAVRHGSGRVAILLSAHGDRFDLTVIDDGPGLPDMQLADLSLRTFTDDPARRRSEGLGLAIVGEVARRAGWEVRYERPEEGGLRVRLTGQTLTGGLRRSP